MSASLTRRAVKPHHRGVTHPLILVPCLLCDETVWSAQRAALASVAQTHVAAHGRLDSLAALAEAIIARAPPRFAIAGHSMGGRIALEVVRRVPERVVGVALLGTGCEALAPGEEGQRETQRRHALLDLARREGMRAMARVWVEDMIYPARLADAALVDSILDMFERRTPDELAAQIRALLGRPDARSVLSSLDCPTLVLCGREDLASPPARNAVIAAQLSGGRLSVIPECGHMAPQERPDAVSDALQGWLKDIERAG